MSFEKYSENKWIVKSDSKILGPYSYEQIQDLIQKKQISLIDEVRDSETRWLYVRENPEFAKIVEAIRKELDAQQDSTKTYQSISKTFEQSLKTKTEIPQFSNVTIDVQEASVVKEIIQNQINDKAILFEDSSRREKVKFYGFQKDQSFKNQIEQNKKRNLIVALVAVVIVAAGGYGFLNYQKYNLEKQDEQLILSFKKFKFMGLDRKAISLYEKFSDSNKAKVLPELIDYFPFLEPSGQLQIQDIERLQEKSTLNIEQKANVELVYFWSAMQSQNINLAQEHLVKAHTLQPTNMLIKENEALIEFMKNKYQKSYQLFSELVKQEVNGRYLLGMGLNVAYLPDAEKNLAMQALSQQIENYTNVKFEFRKELLLVQLALSHELKNDILYQLTWKNFLNTPVALTNFFKKPSLLMPHAYDWKSLLSLTQNLKNVLTSEEAVFLDVHSQLELGAAATAESILKTNLGKIKDNQQRQQLSLLVYYTQGRSGDIVALDKTNQLDVLSPINHFLIAMSKLDLNAQANIENHLKNLQSSSLQFYHDWLQLNQLMKTNQLDAIRSFTKTHFVTTPNFIPLIEAKSMVE